MLEFPDLELLGGFDLSRGVFLTFRNPCLFSYLTKLLKFNCDKSHGNTNEINKFKSVMRSESPDWLQIHYARKSLDCKESYRSLTNVLGSFVLLSESLKTVILVSDPYVLPIWKTECTILKNKVHDKLI